MVLNRSVLNPSPRTSPPSRQRHGEGGWVGSLPHSLASPPPFISSAHVEIISWSENPDVLTGRYPARTGKSFANSTPLQISPRSRGSSPPGGRADRSGTSPAHERPEPPDLTARAPRVPDGRIVRTRGDSMPRTPSPGRGTGDRVPRGGGTGGSEIHPRWGGRSQVGPEEWKGRGVLEG